MNTEKFLEAVGEAAYAVGLSNNELTGLVSTGWRKGRAGAASSTAAASGIAARDSATATIVAAIRKGEQDDNNQRNT